MKVIWFLIPLEPGGKRFVDCCKGVSVVEGGYLKIFIAASVAEGIGIRNGTKVQVDNQNEELKIQLADPS